MSNLINRQERRLDFPAYQTPPNRPSSPGRQNMGPWPPPGRWMNPLSRPLGVQDSVLSVGGTSAQPHLLPHLCPAHIHSDAQAAHARYIDMADMYLCTQYPPHLNRRCPPHTAHFWCIRGMEAICMADTCLLASAALLSLSIRFCSIWGRAAHWQCESVP
ncbi:hypothetical protein B0H19DRAFT_1058125 [Mycena capillaripes]|nr:hypothetical protein B0H19DRAFT_1058125 [Mycena capillaripes]